MCVLHTYICTHVFHTYIRTHVLHTYIRTHVLHTYIHTHVSHTHTHTCVTHMHTHTCYTHTTNVLKKTFHTGWASPRWPHQIPRCLCRQRLHYPGTCRVGQNHTFIGIYGVCTVFGRDITRHIRCIYTVLAHLRYMAPTACGALLAFVDCTASLDQVGTYTGLARNA